MFAADEDSNESINPSKLDIARIESLEIGEKMEQEVGNFSIIRYDKSYVLLLSNPNIRGNHGYFEFTSLERLIQFLNK